jgi:signal transduction histidine kinase
VPPSSPSKPASWKDRIHPPGAPNTDAPFAWLRHLHQPLALAGLYWFDPSQWQLYLLVLVVLVVEWPFCIRLADGVEMYFPVMWTAAGAAYLLGPMILPVYWLAALIGFALIGILDLHGIVPAVGVAAESVKRYRGEPFALDTVVDGELRHFHTMSQMTVRAAAFAAASRLDLGIFPGVAVAETAVVLWDQVVPIPGRMAPARMRARLAEALGTDLVRATRVLDACLICWLLLAYAQGGAFGFAGASLLALSLHAVLKRLTDMRSEVEQRQRMAVIGQTASTVFHQLGRHHGAIGMYAHLVARGAADDAIGEHARRILASVDDANRVIDELLAFGQDRTLNLYRHRIEALVDECVDECRARAVAHDVQVRVTETTPVETRLDKHKIKQALGNVLDNAIDAAPRGSVVEVSATSPNGIVRIAVRDHGTGVAAEVRERLFTPFCTTKPDGVGVGLALAKELVDAHGGRLEWEAADPGARFVISLPHA